ncbi:MAG: Glycosyltransferase Gtf1 [Phycisphaerae bacterium]|nr:Glycosyltransferase Gtf1 [Phycisphaerae bacterium]
MSTLVARGLVFLILALTILVGDALAALRKRQPPRRCGAGRDRHPTATNPPLHLMLTGTFNNPNWFRSHILPLAAADSIGQISVVCDRPLMPLDKVTYICPSDRCRRLLGRSAARAWTLLRSAARLKPDLLMGYHIMPNALLCLVAARLCGGQAVYQMTGGPVQLVGGGCGSENPLLRKLRRPSRLLERLMFAAVRRFDLVVVRGENAAAYLREHGLARRIAIIAGSIDVERFRPRSATARYDMVLVARHIAQKRVDRFLDLIERVRADYPALRAAVAGDGPLHGALREYATHLKLGECVEFLGHVVDVPELLARSRLFVLTSESEGLSIAMMEAMAAGLPVIAPRVGDLGELLWPDQTGLFITLEDLPRAADAVVRLLADPRRLERLSRGARDAVVARHSIEAIARRWDACLGARDGRAARVLRVAAEPIVGGISK